MKSVIVALIILALIPAAFAQARGEQPTQQPVIIPPSSNVFWIARPFTSYAPAVADYVEAPTGSVAPFATGDPDYAFVVLHRVVGDFVVQPGPYWTEVAQPCQTGRVVTAPNGPTIVLHR